MRKINRIGPITLIQGLLKIYEYKFVAWTKSIIRTLIVWEFFLKKKRSEGRREEDWWGGERKG